MKRDLEDRNYKSSIIDLAITKAKSQNRADTLKRKVKPKQSNRPVFATAFDPRMPCIQPIQAKHWRAMVSQDQYLAKVFPQPPLTGFKRQPNIRNHLTQKDKRKACLNVAMIAPHAHSYKKGKI